MRKKNTKDHTQSTSSSSNEDENSSVAASSSDEESYETEIDEEEAEIVRRLAERAYHLPGYNWKQDWLQYFYNNHPLFSICLHHKLHPVNLCMRLVGLIGSVAFGLCLTNIVWLFFFYNQNQAPIFTVSAAGIDIQNKTHYNIFNENDAQAIVAYTRVDFTPKMIVLWTAGGLVHSLFDEFVWSITSCGCCLTHSKLAWMQQYRTHANVFAVLLITLVTAVSSLVLVIRVAFADDSQFDIDEIRSAGINDDNIEITRVKDASNYEFLISYAVELAVAWFIYWPLVGTIMFSGILSCNRGGRPFEVAQEEREKENAEESTDIEAADPPITRKVLRHEMVEQDETKGKHRSNKLESSPAAGKGKTRSELRHDMVEQDETTGKHRLSKLESSPAAGKGKTRSEVAQEEKIKPRSSRHSNGIPNKDSSPFQSSRRSHELSRKERESNNESFHHSNGMGGTHQPSSKRSRPPVEAGQSLDKKIVNGKIPSSPNGVDGRNQPTSKRSKRPSVVYDEYDQVEVHEEAEGKPGRSKHRLSNTEEINKPSLSSSERSGRSSCSTLEIAQKVKDEARAHSRSKWHSVVHEEYDQEEVHKAAEGKPGRSKHRISNTEEINKPSLPSSERSGRSSCATLEIAQEEKDEAQAHSSGRSKRHDKQEIAHPAEASFHCQNEQVAQDDERRKQRRINRATV